MPKRTKRRRSDKNLTRYTREKTSFLGWRVSISREGSMFTKYLPDRTYGGEEGAKKAAIQLRDEILEACSKRSPKEVLEEYRALYAPKKKLKDESDSAVDVLE